MTRLETVTIGPLGFEFLNQNTAMKLKGHRHYATLEVTFQSIQPVGFPAFEDTVEHMVAALQEATRSPFKDPGTNEQVAGALFDLFNGWDHPSCAAYGCRGATSVSDMRTTDSDDNPANFRLLGVRMGVMGVRDDIGHKPGLTYYEVRREAL